MDVAFAELYDVIAEKISSGDSIVFTANGTSMLPLIRGGVDRVTLSPLPDRIRKNDIVFYRRRNGVFVLHRVVRVSRDGSFVFCGDHQFALEKGIQPDQLLAILTALEHDGSDFSFTTFSYRAYCFFLPLRRTVLRTRNFLYRKLRYLKSVLLH